MVAATPNFDPVVWNEKYLNQICLNNSPKEPFENNSEFKP
jgi:hypothetical protein